MGNIKNDHRPKGARLVVRSGFRSNAFRRRKPQYDRSAVFQARDSVDPAVKARVESLDAYMLSMPPVPVEVEASSHRYLMAQYAIDGLATHFPLMQIVKKREFLSDSTFGNFCEESEGHQG